jgi:hypothetical protein
VFNPEYPPTLEAIRTFGPFFAATRAEFQWERSLLKMPFHSGVVDFQAAAVQLSALTQSGYKEVCISLFLTSSSLRNGLRTLSFSILLAALLMKSFTMKIMSPDGY